MALFVLSTARLYAEKYDTGNDNPATKMKCEICKSECEAKFCSWECWRDADVEYIPLAPIAHDHNFCFTRYVPPMVDIGDADRRHKTYFDTSDELYEILGIPNGSLIVLIGEYYPLELMSLGHVRGYIDEYAGKLPVTRVHKFEDIPEVILKAWHWPAKAG